MVLARRKRFNDFMLLAVGEIVHSPSTTYAIEGVAGTGAFGAVYVARDPAKPGRVVALKEFFTPTHPRELKPLAQLFEREVYVGNQASPHPLMPTFYESFDFDSRHYIAQEFIPGETLETIIVRRHPLPREWILKWSVSLCDALAFLHERKIVHHDLKPANIRISPQGHLTLLDFGAAQYFEVGGNERKQVELYGTVGYLPPEIDGDGKWIADARTDVFSLGCIIYEMIAGESPDQDQINDRSMYVTNSLIQRPNADLNLVKLINKALSYNTDFRYGSADDFLKELRNIAPPVLLVDRKHMRFGSCRVDDRPIPQTVSLYNAGGGILRGEIKPRSTWLIASPSSFRENERTVTVTVDPSKIDNHDVLTVGKLEINSTDILSEDGTVDIAGDRWFIECSIYIESPPPHLTFDLTDAHKFVELVVSNATQNSQKVSFRNSGGKEGTFKLALYDFETDMELSHVTLIPSEIALRTNEAGTLTVTLGDSDPSQLKPRRALLRAVCLENSSIIEQEVHIEYADTGVRHGMGAKLKGLFGLR